VLAQIDGRFGGIPLKPRRHTQMSLHKRMYRNLQRIVMRGTNTAQPPDFLRHRLEGPRRVSGQPKARPYG
jgi:IS5 family transposase